MRFSSHSTTGLLENTFEEQIDEYQTIVEIYCWPTHTSMLVKNNENLGNTDNLYLSIESTKNDESHSGFYSCLHKTRMLFGGTYARLRDISEIEREPYPKKYTLTSRDGIEIDKISQSVSQLLRDIKKSSSKPDNETGLEDTLYIDQNTFYWKIKRWFEKPKSQPYYYGIAWGKKSNFCSHVVLKNLEKGGFRKLLPYYANLLDPRHMMLLSLRPAFAVAILSPIFYSFLVLHKRRDIHTRVIAYVAFTLQLTITLILDKYLLPSKYLPGFKKSNIRTRKLVEAHRVDIIIQLIELLGFGYGGLVFRAMLPRNVTEFFQYKFGLDLLWWSAESGFGFLFFGYLSSLILHTTCGLRTLVAATRPCGVEHLMKYVQDTQELSPLLRSYYFKKESALLLMPLCAILGGYVAWRDDSKPLRAVLLGTSIGAGSGYILTKIVHCCLNKKSVRVELSKEEDESRLDLYNSHNSKPEQFGLVSVGTVFGIVAAIALTQGCCTDDVYVNGLVSLLGTIVGYLTGAYTHLAFEAAIAKGHSLFSANDSSDNTDYELALDRRRVHQRHQPSIS